MPKVRVIDGPSNRQFGVMNTHEAIKLAKQRGLDLVEVSGTARPPVCKIVDYGKYKYDQQKLQKDQPKKTTRLKEVKFRVGVAEHDYEIKVTRAEGFLMHGNKVRIQLMFRGRQMAHKEIGFELMEQVKEDLVGVAHVDMDPKLAGRHITMMLSPVPEHMRKPKYKLEHEDEHEDEDFEDEDFDDDEDDDEEGASDGEDKAAKKKGGEEEEVREKPNEDHQHLGVEEEIALLEGDTGRPKSKRGG